MLNRSLSFKSVCFITMILLSMLFLTACSNSRYTKEETLNIQKQIKARFEYASKVKNLENTAPDTYKKIQERFNEAQACIATGNIDQAMDVLSKLSKALEEFNIYEGIVPYYLASNLKAYNTDTALTSVESETKDLEDNVTNALSISGKVRKSTGLLDFIKTHSDKYSYNESSEVLSLKG